MSGAHQVTTFLWFERDAEAAARHYVSIFDDARIVEASPQAVTFEIGTQRYIGLNGGPTYRLTPAVSLYVSVETQAELDRIWDRLLEGGGEPTRCGWLEDRFGLSWQVIPTALPRLLRDPDPARARRALESMLSMQKLDIAALETAAAG